MGFHPFCFVIKELAVCISREGVVSGLISPFHANRTAFRNRITQRDMESKFYMKDRSPDSSGWIHIWVLSRPLFLSPSILSIPSTVVAALLPLYPSAGMAGGRFGQPG